MQQQAVIVERCLHGSVQTLSQLLEVEHQTHRISCGGVVLPRLVTSGRLCGCSDDDC
jgi:transposase-like protein